MKGDFTNGWKTHFKVFQQSDLFVDIDLPWLRKIQKVNILVIRAHSGIGVGDTVMYSRLIHELQHQNFDCIIEIEERMKPIFERSFPKAIFITSKELGDRYQKLEGAQQVLLGALPYILGLKDTRDINAQAYIKQNHQEALNLRKKYAIKHTDKSNQELLVGISWISKGNRGKYRSIPLEKWADILNVQGIRFISLQYGIHDNDIPSSVNLLNDTSVDPLNNLDLACAQIAAMDLVISIDNSTVHFASAMGVEVWALLPKSADWRWQAQGDKSYWYESLRLYRQNDPRNWQQGIEEIKQDLVKWVKNKASSRDTMLEIEY